MLFLLKVEEAVGLLFIVSMFDIQEDKYTHIHTLALEYFILVHKDTF